MGLADDFTSAAGVPSQGVNKPDNSLAGQFSSSAGVAVPPKRGAGSAPTASELAAYPVVQSIERTPGDYSGEAVKQALIHAPGNLLYGVAKGAADFVQGPAQLAVNGLALTGNPYLKQKAADVNQYLSNQEKDYQEDTSGPGSAAAGLGRVGASVAPFIISGGTSGAASVPAAVSGWGAVGAGAKAAAQGALYGAMQPVNSNPQSVGDFFAEKGKQAAVGAGTSLAGKIIGSGVAKAMNPNVSPDVRTLIDNGVNLTPGQILGGGFKATEDKATSIPVLGDVIKNAQRRTMGDFNTAALNRAGELDPVTGQVMAPIVSEGGQAGVGQAQDYFNSKYDKILGQMSHQPDQQFESDVLNSIQKNRAGVPGQDEIGGMMSDTYRPLFTNNVNGVPTMSGADIKNFQTQLRLNADKYNRAPNPADQNIGAAYGDIQKAFRDSLERHNSPQAVQQLKDIDRQYANFKQYQNASLGAGAAKREGIITPADYLNSILSYSKKTGNTGTFSNGGAMNQDFANAAQNVIGNTYPDSGTAGRGMLGVLAGGGMFTHPVATVGAGAVGGMAALPYTRTGQGIVQSILTAPRPAFVAPIANSVKVATPIIGTAMGQQYLTGQK